jgi:hypothetical protein
MVWAWPAVAALVSGLKKAQRPVLGRALRQGDRYSRSGLVRLLPGDTGDVAAGNSNVGQLTVAQLGKFLHGEPISLPALEKANNRRQHGFRPFSGIWPESQEKYGVALLHRNKIGAVQLIQNRMAKDRYLLDFWCSSAQWSVTLH